MSSLLKNAAYRIEGLSLSTDVELAKLKTQIEAITKEVIFINHFIDVRRQFYFIVEASPVGTRRNIFWSFLHYSFAHELVIRICRLGDNQFNDPAKQIFSIRALLYELRGNPELLSREHFIGCSPCTLQVWAQNPMNQFRSGHPMVDIFNAVNTEFDRLAGAGRGFYSKSLINRDLDKFKKAMKPLRAYRNKVLAHNAIDQTLPGELAFDKVLDAAKVVTEISKKYYSLIMRTSHPMNVAKPNITTLFLEPWISSRENAGEIYRRPSGSGVDF